MPTTPIPLSRLRPGRPSSSDTVHNARIMRGDSVAMGVVNAASTYLPVLVARLGGSAFQIGLLTAIPAVAGFTLAIPVGQYLKRKTAIVTWYSVARLISNLSYATIALAVVLAPRDLVVPLIMVIWAVAALPSTIGSVLFPIVMDGTAGPHGRLELMSRRWSYMGLTMAIVVSVIGQLLDQIPFPANYGIVFCAFSLAGVASFHFSRQFRIPQLAPAPTSDQPISRAARIRGGLALVKAHPAFLTYSVRQLVYVTGSRFVLPLYPLYYVTVVNAPDAWIGIIATGQSLALLAGYQFWRRQSRRLGTRTMLLVVLLVSSLYPAALSLTSEMVVVATLATASAFFAAGVDLILFDEMMARVPREHAVTFVSIDTTLVNFATIIAPLVGALLAGITNIEAALQVGAIISLIGVAMFAQAARQQGSTQVAPAAAAQV